MKKKQFESLVKFISICAAVVVFGLTLLAVVQFVKIGAAKKKKQTLENKYSALIAEEQSLKSSIERHNDLSYAEEYAREHLGYIKDGDVIYEIN